MTRLNDRTLRLVDIDIDEVDGIVRLVTEEMRYVFAVLTAYDGVGQRRLVVGSSGILKVVEESAADIYSKLAGIDADTNIMQAKLTSMDTDTGNIATDVGYIDDDLKFTWGRTSAWSGTRYVSMPEYTTDKLAELLVQGLFHDEYTGDPTYCHTITSIAEILFDCYNAATHRLKVETA